MAQDNEGKQAQGAPPSFIPANSHRRTSTTGTSTAQLGGATVPPSFTPPSHHRGESAPAASSAARSTANRVSSSGSSPTSRRANAASRSASRSASSDSKTRSAAHPSTVPQSFTPAATRARTSAAPRAPQPAAQAPQHSPMQSRNFSHIPSNRPGISANVAARRRHGARHIVRLTVLILLGALAIAVFGGWGWIDSRLNKENDWLTTKANGTATSWLILGSDERDGTTGGSSDDTPGFRTDTILMLIKPKSGPSALISIPRDSLVQVDGQYMKINAAAEIGGNKALVEAVESISGLKVNHIAKIKFGGLQNVVNAIGGVNLCYDQTVNDPYSGLDWQAGCHTVDGGTALAFSRMRYADANGDFGRAQRQRQVIGAIISKTMSKETLTSPSKVTKAMDAALSAVTVDHKTSPLTLARMAFAFKSATGSKGISGSVYWTDPDYTVDGVGSSVLLDETRNTELFSQLAAGSHAAGKVGTLSEG